MASTFVINPNAPAWQKKNADSLEIVAYGLQSKGFKMKNVLVDITEKAMVSDTLVEFRIKKGALVFNGKPMEKTSVLEIHYKTLPDASPGEYALAVHNVAFKFCNENCLIIGSLLNSWPTFKATVFEPDEKHLAQ